jgi:ribulose-bisphosphate carboxylase large chain
MRCARKIMRREHHKKPRKQDAPVRSRFSRNFRWKGVQLEPYKLATHAGGEFKGASRQVLVGKRGERVKFHLRYFELEPGGFTSLEQHHHAHVVVGVRGKGRARVGNRKYPLKAMDMVYIAPNRPHQLSTVGGIPFGFFCIVDAERDRPRPVKK